MALLQNGNVINMILFIELYVTFKTRSKWSSRWV